MNALCEPGNDTDDIQFTVKGSSAPAPSFAVDFYRAARLCFVDIVITRPGYDPIRLTRFHGNFEEEDDNRVIFLDLAADGSHATKGYYIGPAELGWWGVPDEDGGPDDDDAPDILADVVANAGMDDSDTASVPRSDRPDDDDKLEAYAAIYDIVASSPSTPRAAPDWMKKAEFHLIRYRDVIPVASAGDPPHLPTETDRWRLLLSAVGVKMEYLLLQTRAHRLGLGTHWASSLGTALREIRALFPPTGDADFRGWDPAPL